MSESPKMGLFGSKDETKETKKETKDGSPDRYAPYCIDSDSETYDTEALSIMDINDIIGVQSEPVSDSTLESEIAALSQMITESKTDASQNTIEKKLKTQEKDEETLKELSLFKNEKSHIMENSDIIYTSNTNEHLKSTLEGLKSVCCAEEIISDNMEQSNIQNSVLNNENNIQESLQFCEQKEDNDTKGSCESNVLIDSVNVIDTKNIDNSNVTNEIDMELIQPISDSISVTSEIEKNKEKVNSSDVSEQNKNIYVTIINSEVNIIKNENSIRGSLQLIGEAYSSEDSQEAILNNEEPKESSLAASSNETNVTNMVCDLQEDVNNASQVKGTVSLIQTNYASKEEENKRLCNIEVDSFNIESKYAEEVHITLEDIRDVSNENKVNNPSNNILQCSEETVSVIASDTNNVEEVSEENKLDTQVLEEAMTLEHSKMQVNVKNDESLSNICVAQETKISEVEIADDIQEVKEDQEIVDYMIIEEQGSQENKEYVSTSNNESIIVDNNEILSIELNDEIIADNDTEITKKVNEIDLESIQSVIPLKDLDNTTSDNVEKFDLLQVINNSEVSKDKFDKVKLSGLKEETEIKKLETIEADLKQNSLEPINNQLSPKINNQTLMISKDVIELPSDSVNLIGNTTDMVNNKEIDVEIENEENKLYFVSSEVSNNKVIEGESIDSTQLISTQEELKDELKTVEKDLDTGNKSGISVKMDSNMDSQTPVLNSDAPSNIVCTLDMSTAKSSVEDKIDRSLEKNIDKKIKEMEINDVEGAKIKNYISEQQSQESIEIENTVVEKVELEETINIADNFNEDIESKDIEISEQCEDIKVKGQVKEVVTVEAQIKESETLTKQMVHGEIVKKQIEEEKVMKEQIEEEKIMEEQIEEEKIMEEQIEEEKIKEEQIEKEKIMEEQIKEEPVGKEVEENNTVEEQTGKGNKENPSLPVIIEEEQQTEIKNEINELKSHESICDLTKENHPEQLEKSEIQKETNIEIEEIADCVNEEDTISNLNFIDKVTFSPLNHTEVMVSEEDANEERIEEEMNLALEPEEIELKSEIIKSDVKEKFENEKYVKFSEEIINAVQEDSVVKMDYNIADSSMEKSNVVEIDTKEVVKSHNIEDSTINENEELLEKQESEDNDLKGDGNKDNLKDILETTNNVEKMFSREQCQNTQDIVTSILDDVRSATDFKNILSTEANVTNEIEEVFQQSESLPLVETEIDELTEKLPQDSDLLNKDIEDSISTQNIDSLEGLLGLDLMPEREDPTLKATKVEEELQNSDQLSKVVDMSLLLDQSNHSSGMGQASDYITHVISSCLTDKNTIPMEGDTEKLNTVDTESDKVKESKISDILQVGESIIPEITNKDGNIEDLPKNLRGSADLQENELDVDFEEAPLESVDDLEETETKLELTSDILSHDENQSGNLNEAPSGVETSQASSEISELESAVKFLQESEEQAMDSPLVLSPKMVGSVVDDISKQTETSSLFVPDEDTCENTSELEVELQNITTDSISISEAEIISEAVKLESERKLAEQIKIDALQNKLVTDDDKEAINVDVIEEKITVPENFETKFDVAPLENIEMPHTPVLEDKNLSETIISLPQNVLKISESIPKISILEERLKEPPKIEIPATDMTKVSMSMITSKDSLLIQKDAKLIAYQKMLESPKLSDKSEPKLIETPRKDSEKHDFENVGSPRIILKIVKSAITDCGEPRSPKSPKIRSATNSPNPEDSPGQKLGKIKLKLSKSGHPSIISNENIEEVGQWYTEGSSSLSPIGMKIKLSKTGDASIVSSEKHESNDDSKDGKHKFEEIRRTESPIGMKIKLSKSGDASIVQQDSKDIQMKHKDKLDMIQGSPKRTESPIGMKIKLSKTGDASIIQPERQDLLEEYKDNAQMKPKEKLEQSYDSPKRTDSPIGMKIKLSKTGDASIVSPDLSEESKEVCKVKEKLESSPEIPKRTESPIGMKIKLAKIKGGASIISVENSEESKDKLEIPDIPRRTESPLGMKIKLSKTGDASIVHSEVLDEIKEKLDIGQDTAKSLESYQSCGMKMKVIKSDETQHIETITQESIKESIEIMQEALSKIESPIGMKIKLSKFGDASIVPSEKQEQSDENKFLQDLPKRTESPLGMKIKLSKTGDASIIQPESVEETNKMIRTTEAEYSKPTDTSLGMKIKLLKTGDASIVDPEKKDKQQKRRDTESPLEMKIKLSKTGHPTIVACDSQAEVTYKSKETTDLSQNFAQRYKEGGQAGHKESVLKILKAGHSTILQSNRSELTIEPVQIQGKKPDNAVDISPKRKDITIAPIESKKSKLETQFTQILPEVTIQPVTSREQKQFLFDPKSSAISLQQMNVINQEISITQVRPQKLTDATTMSEKLKDILSKNVAGSPMHSDCEIIEHRPELIIVNENSNSSQDVVIIEEVSPNRVQEIKVPKKRGRPRRNPLPQGITHASSHLLIPRDPLSLDDTQQMQQPQLSRNFSGSRENERPKRTCRSQKSYAPPRRGRGRGRGKRKLDSVDPQIVKKARIEQDLNAIEASTTAVITIDDSLTQQQSFGKSPELYKVLKQPAMDSKVTNSSGKVEKKIVRQKNDKIKSASIINNTLPDIANIQSEINKVPEMRLPKPISNDIKDSVKDRKSAEIVSERLQKTTPKVDIENRSDKTTENAKPENKDMLVPPGHPNWLTPASKRIVENTTKHENISTVQVIDEETRMSAESGSRSQTPARNISAPASETIANEESQGSVLSTATTESEKVKVKNRRMEINFDPDEGPFTVDKIAEYEWPLDRKGETFMIQEQISQYLGVKSFKRKYPDLKRRVVDMEERNYLRENGLVSEAMCDMGLTAICSSEVLDVMCSDFPDQYEEYRKHMREKQVKEHSKKQKELTAAANAEKNRIDLAEMAVQSALSWNIDLNKARRENRKCSLDLQTFTIHVPKKQQKVETERKIGHYPVALIPGQYTDYYREYTPAELRYYPLNTVLYGPMRPNERKFDSQSEGSQSDSDSDSSTDDSSSSSSEGTQDTEGSQSTMDEVDIEITHQKDEIKLKCKMCLKVLNKHSKNEVLIQCGTCNGHVHPSCIDLTLDMVPHIQSYAWQCTDCKTCAQCHDPADEDKMLFCDMCDRGYHIYCVGLRRVPQGRWHCQECAVCANCGSREPGGINSDRNSVAQWQHEYKKGDKNTRVYVSTLCVPCSKLWRKGRYCPHCSRCHTAPRLDLEANLVHCSACDKYLHLGCVETKGMLLDRKNYLCDFCALNRQPLISKTLKT